MVDKKLSKIISIRKQCALLGVNRSSVYYQSIGEREENLSLMRILDELYLKYPFYGSRKIVYHLKRQGIKITRDRVRRLMRLMGLRAIYQKPRTSQKNPNHKIYPYLLRDKVIERPNQVWATDITYIPMKQGFMYLVAIQDWYSRKVLSWSLSNTLSSWFCIETLKEALAKYRAPEIFNTDQGSQFTSLEFTGALSAHNIKISMDGKGRWMDNVFVERLWRSLKYECVYLQEFETTKDLQKGLEAWINFYNHERPHATFDGQTPNEVYNQLSSLLMIKAA